MVALIFFSFCEDCKQIQLALPIQTTCLVIRFVRLLL